MKNVIVKRGFYNEIIFFAHIYFVDVNETFNEKSVDEIMDFIDNDPFCDIMIHANDFTLDIIEIIKRIPAWKKIWFQSDKLLFEDFAVMNQETRKNIWFDRIEVMIDTLGDIIDVRKSIENECLVNFDYMDVPF